MPPNMSDARNGKWNVICTLPTKKKFLLSEGILWGGISSKARTARYGRNTPTPLIFENLKPLEKSKNYINIIWTSSKIAWIFKIKRMWCSNDFLISLLVSGFQRSVWGCSIHICSCPFLRQETCSSTRPRRRIRMDQDQPNLCPILEAFEEYFNGSMSCKHWPGNFFKHHDKRNETLEHEMYQYAKGQLISKCLLGIIVSTKKPSKFL